MNIIHSAVYISDAKETLMGSSGISCLKKLICLDMTQLQKMRWFYVCKKALEMYFLVESDCSVRKPGTTHPEGEPCTWRQLFVIYITNCLAH